jgi:asparagine synthase (glutamine-hydrolysing)
MDMDFFEKFNKRSPVKRAVRGVLNNDLYHAFGISPLPALLHADDRSSMAHSIETRSPFLDYRLVEFAFSMPADFKIHDGVTKYVLRKAMRGTVPDMLLDRKDKMGFPTPIRTWMQGELKHEVEDILNSRAFLKRPYFDHKKLKQLEGAGRLNGEENLFTVWNWVNLELWMRKFIDNPKV